MRELFSALTRSTHSQFCLSQLKTTLKATSSLSATMIKRILILALASMAVLSHSAHAEEQATGPAVGSVRANQGAQLSNAPAPTNKASPSYSFATAASKQPSASPTTGNSDKKNQQPTPTTPTKTPAPKTTNAQGKKDSPATAKPGSTTPPPAKAARPTPAPNSEKQAGRGALRG